mgnify:FL=1
MADLNAKTKRFSPLKPGQYILRLICAWLFGASAATFVSGVKATEEPLLNTASVAAMLITAAAVFIATCFIKSDKKAYIILIAAAETFCISVPLKEANLSVPISMGLCLILCAAVAYSDLKDINVKISNRTVYITVAALLVAMTVYIGAACIVRYNNYEIKGYDHGLFDQMFYYMKNTGLADTTFERNRLMSHFQVHCSPVFYLLLPLYIILPSSQALLVINGFILISGIVPLMFLCKKYNLSNIATVLFCACYAIYPALAGNGLWGLHENSFLAPFVLWFFYFSEKDSHIPTVVFAVLILCVKEDAPIYLAIITIYYIISGKSLKRNIPLLALSLAYFFAVTALLQKYGLGIMSNRYENYVGEDGSLIGIIKSFITNPAFTLSQAFNEKKLLFLVQLFAPLCFLPFMTKKPARLILLTPILLVNLMTNYKYMPMINYQYVIANTAILFYMSVAAYSEMGEKRKKILVCALLFSTVFALSNRLHPTYLTRTAEQTAWNEKMTSALSVIPSDASVAATNSPSGQLTQRKELYCIYTADDLKNIPDFVEYYVVRLDGSQKTEKILNAINNGNYKEYLREDGVVAIYKK